MSDTRLMTCEQLDERLADWLEQEVDAHTDAALARHVAGCARCEAIVNDLRSIRRAAASLPELTPSRDLWPGIEARIQAPVITLKQSRAAHRAPRSSWWMGAAAAGLVAVTAGVTYLVTKNGATPAETTIAAAPPTVRGPDTAPPAIVTKPAAPVAGNREESRTERSAQSAVRNVSEAENSEYARDVAQLRKIVTQRRTEFDSTTIAVLERNLELIDRAIAESRAALQRDPASEFLADQLARAMTKKVAILRTVALLPARS